VVLSSVDPGPGGRASALRAPPAAPPGPVAAVPLLPSGSGPHRFLGAGGHKSKTEARSPAAETAGWKLPCCPPPRGPPAGGAPAPCRLGRGQEGKFNAPRSRGKSGGGAGRGSTCASPPQLSASSPARAALPALPCPALPLRPFHPHHLLSPARGASVPWVCGGLGFRARLASPSFGWGAPSLYAQMLPPPPPAAAAAATRLFVPAP
jgi:hypothetical protein